MIADEEVDVGAIPLVFDDDGPEPTPLSMTSRRLLDAAADLIVERGIDRITMTDVAVRAGVSVGTAYRHHADRDAILQALYVRHTTHMHDVLVEVASTSHGSLEADVRALLEATLRVHRTLPAYQAVRAWQWLRPEARGHRMRAVESLARRLSEVLAPRWGTAQDDARRQRIVDVIRQADALVLTSFLDDPATDDASLAKVLVTVEALLVPVIRADLDR